MDLPVVAPIKDYLNHSPTPRRGTSCCIRLMTFTGISSEGWMLDAGPRGKTLGFVFLWLGKSNKMPKLGIC